MILCCGEALIDMIPGCTDTMQTAFVPHSGGAVYNTAVALGRLGTPVALLSVVSNDAFGQQLACDMRASNVSDAYVVRSDRPTTLAFVHLTDGHATYEFYDENSAGRMLEPGDIPEIGDEVSTLFFGGISLVCEPSANTLLGLAEREAGRRSIYLDPNIRPAFFDDVGRYRARLKRLFSCAHIVKVSDEDLDWLDPSSEPSEDKAQKLALAEDFTLILTRGSKGASAFLPSGEVVHTPVRRVAVADTVGAGDTFNAGVLAHFIENGLCTISSLKEASAQDWRRALSFASEAAALTVSKAGANPPWRDEILIEW